MIEILSLGAGVQSSTVLLKSVAGELPKLDYAIFADTGWEPKSVYGWFSDVLIPAADGAGIKVRVVSNGNIRDDILSGRDQPPWYVKPSNSSDRPGSLMRQCTTDYKVVPIERALRAILGLKKGRRWPKEPTIRQWFGISYDEIQRMKISQRPAIENWYPLVEKNLTRGHCLEWLQKNGYPQAPRSACIGCPYHSNKEWLSLSKVEFNDAVYIDRSLREKKREWAKGELFAHPSLKPLSEVDFTDPHENQISLLDECDGLCGV
jgi:hypothetical protein